MGSNAAMERLKGELYRLVDHMRADLDRVEILIAALNGFSRPVPGYEPRFRHLRGASLGAHELETQAGNGPS
jgi:hypothetical protein